ncbi:MAG: alkaline phosphatase family protein [Opitutaceae bacterium]|nr:alkaline phosphatase family protein [Opitutaceae bacterium]
MRSLAATILIVLVSSAAIASETTAVLWMWSGAVTTQTARVTVKVTGEGAPPLSLEAEGEAPRSFAAAVRRPTEPGTSVLVFELSQLRPDTHYRYAVAGAEGRFRSHPAGAASFMIALGSCAQTGSEHPVFATIARHESLLFLHNGDLHYEDIAENSVDVFRRAYGRALGSASQTRLFRSTAVNYVWDDHDFGPNNSDRTSPSREASRAAYREMVPHYPFASNSGAIYHAFTIGRVRFLVGDARSERDPPQVPEGPERTMLGAEQKAWLKREMLAARDRYPLTVWVNSVPWIGTDTGSENEDRWTGFTTERAELAAFIEQNGIHNLCVLSGDAHMVAIDDGTHNRYGPAGRPLFPVFHAAALDRKGSVKGGPYSHGAFGGPGQFGLMRVIDTGGPELRVEWSGRTHEDVELVRYTFSCPVPGVTR